MNVLAVSQPEITVLRTEKDIAGASRNERHPAELKILELKNWLQHLCEGKGLNLMVRRKDRYYLIEHSVILKNAKHLQF